LFLTACLPVIIHAQKDSVIVPGYYETGLYGTLNYAVETAVTNGTSDEIMFNYLNKI